MTLNESMVSYFLDISADQSGIEQIKKESNQINELGFENPSFSLEINKNTTKMGEASGMHFTAKELTIANYTLKKTLSYLLDQSEYRIRLPDSADTKYDIRFQVKQGLDSLNNLKKRLASVIANRLGYSLITVTRPEITYQLKIINDSLFSANFVDRESSYTSSSSWGNNWEGVGLSKKDVIKILEDSYMQYFSDGIGLIDKYTMKIPIHDLNALKERLQNIYGIELKAEKGTVEIFLLIPK